MYQPSSKIKELEHKANMLIRQHQELISVHQRLKDDYLTLIETINQQKAQIEELEVKHKTNNSLQTLEHSKEDQIKTKQIINEMMREIDHCLLLLDK